MFRLYIFDMGGVVSRNANVAPEFAEYLEFDGAKMIDSVRDDFTALTTGTISTEEFTRRFSARSGRMIEEELLIRFFDPELDREVVAIIEGLKHQGRVVAGTNTIAPHYDVHQKRGDYDMFDAVYASQLIGLAKPDPAFYSYILDQERCLPGQAVFIDDVGDNVKAAERLGIHALLFTEADQLKNDLSALEKSAT